VTFHRTGTPCPHSEARSAAASSGPVCVSAHNARNARLKAKVKIDRTGPAYIPNPYCHAWATPNGIVCTYLMAIDGGILRTGSANFSASGRSNRIRGARNYAARYPPSRASSRQMGVAYPPLIRLGKETSG